MNLPRVKIVERKLGRERCVGQAVHGINLVEIDPRQSEYERLDTLVHELFHISFPHATEEEVIVISRWFSRILWRQHYRRLHSP
jgi:hypothetical protein